MSPASGLPFKKDTTEDWGWRYWMATDWCWLGKAPDGRWLEAQSGDSWRRLGVRQRESFALPLQSIESRADLERRVIDPLLQRLAGESEPDVFDLIASVPAGHHSKADLDARLREERAAWGEP